MCGKQSINMKKKNKKGDGLRSIKTYSDTFTYNFHNFFFMLLLLLLLLSFTEKYVENCCQSVNGIHARSRICSKRKRVNENLISHMHKKKLCSDDGTLYKRRKL